MKNTQPILPPQANQTLTPISSIDRQELPDYENMAVPASKHRFSPKRLVLLAGFIILITASATLFINLVNERNSSSASDEIKSVFSGEELKDYYSPESKFTILMPGIPEISKTSSEAGDKEIPVTSYEKVIDNGDKNYTVAVYDYDGLPLDEPKALESAIDSAIGKTPGAQIVSTKLGRFGNLNAIEAFYNVTEKDTTYESHIRCVINGSKMYAIILTGGDQAKFDEFANSLRLN